MRHFLDLDSQLYPLSALSEDYGVSRSQVLWLALISFFATYQNHVTRELPTTEKHAELFD